MNNRLNIFLPFFIWLGIGFLIGLTGTVIASPTYTRLADNEVKLVYAPGLQPQSTSGVQVSTDNNTDTFAREGEFFLKKGCTQCHEVSFYDMPGGVTGPDLSIAYDDVPGRFGKTLEEFLWEPEGTMGAMFPRMDITDEDKKLIFDLLVKASEGAAEKTADESENQENLDS